VDYSILIGSFGWFFMWFLLFCKQLPIMAISELKEVVPPRMKHAHTLEPHYGGSDPQVTGGEGTGGHAPRTT
jgi:hypothetical protein